MGLYILFRDYVGSKLQNVLAGLCLALLCCVFGYVSAEAQEDPYLWLEEIEGAKAIDWVKAQNAQLEQWLADDDVFPAMQAEAMEILSSKDRLPQLRFAGGGIDNFWRDEKAVRGVWRRGSVAGFNAGEPQWETILDLDRLAEEENENWIWGETVCLAPAHRHCMVGLSRGGTDAKIWREFDVERKAFVEGGFFIPEAKSNLAWVDKNMLLVASDFGPGTTTDSGYARQIKAVARGETLSAAALIYEGLAGDVAVSPIVERDGDQVHIFALRAPSFFERIYVHAVAGQKAQTLPMPSSSELIGVVDGQAIYFLQEEVSYNGHRYGQGSVLALALDSLEAQLVMAPTPSQAINEVAIADGTLLVQYLDDVAGRAARFIRGDDGRWQRIEIAVPDNSVLTLMDAGDGEQGAYFTLEGMTQPETLHYLEADNQLTQVRTTPAFFDAQGITVEQLFATSADGTKVPYFVMAKAAVLAADAPPAPTVQYGYGGFLVPTLPVYLNQPARPQHGALAGQLWVRRGGVLVISNIRGGGEYGPAWHRAALKENRQRAYDDFIAISEDLIARGITTPQLLGAVGRSNGGLLMGAMLTQRPDLYAALDIGVPLFDMKRYHQLLAGASWMGEYGNPDVPDEWAYISQYSPYQQIKEGVPYPKVLFYTSTKDDRVHPGHARKAAAKLMALGQDVTYYENMEGGHGGTANQAQLAYRTALEYAFFHKVLMAPQPSHANSKQQ